MKCDAGEEGAVSILLAEDDKVAGEILCSLISKRYPKVPLYFAKNGKDGVELFREKCSSIVITDVKMPVMDGIQMASAIKSLKADTKFIVMTAYSEQQYFDKFHEMGCVAYITKPIEFGKLFSAIDRCFGELQVPG